MTENSVKSESSGKSDDSNKLQSGQIIEGDALQVLKTFPSESVDTIITDPPYGLQFMRKDWDSDVINVEIWKECLRVLKHGGFAFIMSVPRLDCLGEMWMRLREAGFETGFSPIFWAYASGFPKSGNIARVVDKRLGVKPKITGLKKNVSHIERGDSNIGKQYCSGTDSQFTSRAIRYNVEPTSFQAKSLNGSYAGFQPKPAVEIIIVVMKPLSEKTYVDQALKNGKGVTWLDKGRIPFQSEKDVTAAASALSYEGTIHSEMTDKYGLSSWNAKRTKYDNTKGRFPANLLVSDDILNDGVDRRPAGNIQESQINDYNASSYKFGIGLRNPNYYSDYGSFSRYFDLDKWWEEKVKSLPESVRKTFPFLIVPKASVGERDKGLEDSVEPRRKYYADGRGNSPEVFGSDRRDGHRDFGKRLRYNIHPTVKPVKLMAYLVMLGSREGDVVLDPFIGSGTTAIACEMLNRRWIGIEINKGYVDLSLHRIEVELQQDYAVTKSEIPDEL